MKILEIKGLNAKIGDKEILKDFNISINNKEIAVIMGPNGTGKSTLSKVIMGDSNYTVESGDIYFKEELINDLKVNERANKGIFLANQNPIEIDGVTNIEFLKAAISSKNNENVQLYKFIKEFENTSEKLKMPPSLLTRYVNNGFSGGERKKNEILQMLLLKPNLIILDEIDSGLDVDSLKIVCENIMEYYNENEEVAILIITHYNKLLEYIKPTTINIMSNGKIVKTGDYTLGKLIEDNGFTDFGDTNE